MSKHWGTSSDQHIPPNAWPNKWKRHESCFVDFDERHFFFFDEYDKKNVLRNCSL